MSGRGERAEALFRQGYNCAQSLVLSFADVLPLPPETLARLSSSFGGGMGRLREVCGAVSGMFLVLGLLQGYDDPTDRQAKIDHYARVQSLAAAFAQQHGTIICRELLKDCPTTPGGVPQERDEAFYRTRPCAALIASAAELLDAWLQKEGCLE